MSGHHPLRSTTDTAPLLILGGIGVGITLMTIVWVGGALGSLAAGAGWDPPPFSLSTLVTLVSDGPRAIWPDVPEGWIWAGIVFTTLGTGVAAGYAGTAAWRRWGNGLPGLARPHHLKALTGKQMIERARKLRPSLADKADIPPEECGPLLGELVPGGRELRASSEDVILAVMAPRSGKSTALAIPNVRDAPGAVVLTGNKSDGYAATCDIRARRGQVWTFDPQGIVYGEQDMWWDMLAEAATVEGARRLAGSFISAEVDAANRRDFWYSAAGNTLTALFHAAARTGRTINDVLNWLARPADRTPVELLEEVGMTALSRQLEGTIHGAPDTRDGIYETARQCVACLLDPRIAAWVTPNSRLRQFVPRRFVTSTDTLYLLSKDGGGSAAGLIAAATDAVLRAGIRQAERQGGRIDPPLTLILDEAANICRIDDLPSLYSHLGSRGVSAITILQSYRQGVVVWGEPGMDALWSASTVKVLGSGLDDADFVEKISRLVGDHKIPEYTRSYGATGRSTSVTPRLERTLQAADIRALPKGLALLLVTGVRPALIRLRPWYTEPGADEISQGIQKQYKAITARAIAADEESKR